jgi:phospholipid/cholesterol/gamma-HCH transport system permease protein
VRTLADARRSLGEMLGERRTRSLDLRDLTGLDSPGAQLLCGLRAEGIELGGVRREHQSLLDLVGGLELEPLPKVPAVPRWREVLIGLGKGTDAALRDTFDVITFIGRGTSALLHALAHPRELKLASVSRQVAETGLHALPIIGLMAIMISVVIAYQGVAQLRPYGAENLTIDLVAVSVLREMGVLITSIMVAGRSGSAFTAEIGVMQTRDEIDALKGMGMDPMQLLVVPRILGLVITLPLLTFFSDVMGLAGGAMTTHALLHVSPMQYLDRVHQAVDASDLFVGLVKAPVFAFLIAIVGCMHGMRVRGSAGSVGQETTRAVVKTVFLVIVLDALFSILFDVIGL